MGHERKEGVLQLPIVRGIVEKKLWWPLADPYEPIEENLYLRSDDGTDAAAFDKWYRTQSAADRVAVREVVLEWLTSEDAEKISRALWFVGSVDPAELFLPAVEGIAARLGRELGPGAQVNLMFLRFLAAVVRLKVLSVIPHLRRWGEHIDGPTSDWAWTGLVALSGLLALDRDGALAFAKRVTRSSEIYTHPLSYTSILEYFVGGYARTRPDELEALAEAFADAGPEVKKNVLSCVRDQLDVLVRAGFRKGDWAREATTRFAQALEGS